MSLKAYLWIKKIYTAWLFSDKFETVCVWYITADIEFLEEALVQGLLTAKDHVFALGLHLCAESHYFVTSI